MNISEKPTLEELNAIMERTGGSLNLSGTAIRQLPDNLTVGNWLDLEGTVIRQLPDNLTVGGDLYLSGTAIQQLPDNLTVGGWLYLRDTAIQQLPDNLAVGGDLDLRGTAIQQLPDNLTVGGWLYLNGTAIQQLPDNLTVGARLYFGGTEIWDTSMVKRLKDGDCRPGEWIYADGILTHIKREKQVHTEDGDFTFYISKIPGRNVVYDGTFYAHAATLRKGVQDILFKRAKDRGAEVYKQYSLNDRIDTKDAIVMYRIITGACRQGTQQFIDSLPDGLKESYTIREIMEMTNGKYGGDAFREFFEE